MTPTCQHCADYRERIAKLEATVAEQQLLLMAYSAVALDQGQAGSGDLHEEVKERLEEIAGLREQARAIVAKGAGR